MEPIVFADQAFNGKDVLALDFVEREDVGIEAGEEADDVAHAAGGVFEMFDVPGGDGEGFGHGLGRGGFGPRKARTTRNGQRPMDDVFPGWLLYRVSRGRHEV